MQPSVGSVALRRRRDAGVLRTDLVIVKQLNIKQKNGAENAVPDLYLKPIKLK